MTHLYDFIVTIKILNLQQYINHLPVFFLRFCSVIFLIARVAYRLDLSAYKTVINFVI